MAEDDQEIGFDHEQADQQEEAAMAHMQEAGKRKWEAIKAFLHMLVFFTFLLLYTLVLTEENQVSERYLQQVVVDTFSRAGDPYEVHSRQDMEEYLNSGLIQALYGEDMTLHPSDKLKNLSALAGDEFAPNVILGAIQVRQVRVRQGEGCAVRGAYQDFYTTCMPPYSKKFEETEVYGGPEEDPFLYFNRANATNYGGKFATYGPGGYVRWLSNNNVTAAREEVRMLRLHRWIDTQTRALFVDFNLWNPNLSLFAVCRLVFELSPTAVWNFEVRVLTLKPRHLAAFGSGSSWEWVLAIAELCLALFVLYYVAEEFSELSVGVGTYMSDGWNIIDWITLLLLMAHFAFRGINIIGGGGMNDAVGHAEMANPYAYVDLQGYAENAFYMKQINAFNIMLVWIKCVKYVPMFPYANVLKTLVSEVWKFFVSFFCIFLLFFAGFALAYTTGFGSAFGELEDWGSAMFFLARGLVGDVDVTMIYKHSRLPGSILTVIFVLGVYMVLLNVFYALMLYAYSQTREAMLQKGASPEDKSQWEMISELYKATMQNVDWEKLMKKFVPGLHARTLQTWRRHEAKIKKRSERRLEIEMSQTRQAKLDRDKSGYSLMPFNRTLGGAQSPGSPGGQLALENQSLLNTSAKGAGDRAIDVESDVSDKSMDLGPLSPPIVRKKMNYMKRMGDDNPLHVPLDDLKDAVTALGDQLSARISYIGSEVKQEMQETREVMGGIRDVIGLLNRRVKDLDSIQKMVL